MNTIIANNALLVKAYLTSYLIALIWIRMIRKGSLYLIRWCLLVCKQTTMLCVDPINQLRSLVNTYSTTLINLTEAFSLLPNSYEAISPHHLATSLKPTDSMILVLPFIEVSAKLKGKSSTITDFLRRSEFSQALDSSSHASSFTSDVFQNLRFRWASSQQIRSGQSCLPIDDFGWWHRIAQELSLATLCQFWCCLPQLSHTLIVDSILLLEGRLKLWLFLVSKIVVKVIFISWMCALWWVCLILVCAFWRIVFSLICFIWFAWVTFRALRLTATDDLLSSSKRCVNDIRRLIIRLFDWQLWGLNFWLLCESFYFHVSGACNWVRRLACMVHSWEI